MQRCQAHARTFAIAAFEPACASLIASWTPSKPRETRPQKRRPERLGFGFADVDAHDFAAAGFVDAMRDHQSLRHDAAAVADFLDFGVQEDVRVAPSSGRLRNASTCSSSAPQMRLTSDFETRSPRLSTRESTRLVETPHT